MKFFASWKLLSLLALLLLVKLFSALEGYPPTWCDEIVYAEPAVNFVQNGRYAAPAIARQLETKGLKGLDEHCFLSPPLGTYARVAMYELFGANQTGRRLTDWVFLVLTTTMLLWLLSRWVTPPATLLTGIIFVLDRIVADDFGRPDLLSLLFGLAALFFVTRQTNPAATEKSFFGQAYVVGLLIGLSGLCHQFGGVFWGVIVVAVQVARPEPRWRPVKIAQWLAFFVLGGLTAALFWLPQIATAPQAWHQQFFYMLDLKYHLAKSFAGSARVLAADTFGKNPAVCLFVAASVLAVKWRNAAQTRLRRVLMVCFLLLAVWRCHSFEPYIRQYSIHFWAVICILFAFAFDEWSAWLKQRISSTWAHRFHNASIVLIILAGSLTTYVAIAEAFLLPFHETRNEITVLLRENISPNDQVLVDAAFYYDVPARNKSIWYWSEKLDLSDYDVVVAPFPSLEAVPVSDGKDRDQWNNCFSPEQAAVFRRDFKLIAQVPSIYGVPLAPHLYTPRINGCYIYRNLHPHP
jgi:hypothetical protein